MSALIATEETVAQIRGLVDGAQPDTRYVPAGAVAELLARLDASVYLGDVPDATAADIRAHVRGMTEEKASYESPRGGWTCFHCGERFLTEEGARLHFGGAEMDPAACKLNAMEGGILELYRQAQKDLREYRTDDTAASRTLYELGAKHAGEMRRAEEEGYAKGLRDARGPWKAPPRVNSVTAYLVGSGGGVVPRYDDGAYSGGSAVDQVVVYGDTTEPIEITENDEPLPISIYAYSYAGAKS